MNSYDFHSHQNKITKVNGKAQSFLEGKKPQENLKVKASEALYAGIFNHSAESIFLVNVQGKEQFTYAAVNPAYERAAQKSQTELIGKKPEAVFPQKLARHFVERYQACLAAASVLKYDETLELRQGKRTWRTILVPIRDASGKIIQLQGSSRDITAEKQAQEQEFRHNQSQNLLTSLILRIRQSLDIDDILQTTVTEIQHTFKADRVVFMQLMGNYSLQVIHEAVIPELPIMKNVVIEAEHGKFFPWENYAHGDINACGDVYETVLPPWLEKFSHQYQIRANLVVPIVLNLQREEEAATVWGLVCVHNCYQPRRWLDWEMKLLEQLASQISIAVYQARLLEQEINNRKALARSNAELEKFAYIASHDLQEPLNTINSYGELLQRRYQGKLDAKADRFLHHIVSSSRHMQSMIKDLLVYSRMGNGQDNFKVVDCHQIIRQAIANLQQKIEETQAIISYNFLPEIMADPVQLEQLWQNLISNALKYRSANKPEIYISAFSQGSSWCFSIQDNGIGIKPEYRQRIFQIFQRLHTQEEYPGTGIGLAVCQKIVEHHGGKIWVESAEGKGSTFYFTLRENN